MCKGLQDWMISERQEGHLEGQAEGAMSKAQTVAHNMFKRNMSAEDAAAICEESLEQMQKWFAEWKRQP